MGEEFVSAVVRGLVDSGRRMIDLGDGRQVVFTVVGSDRVPVDLTVECDAVVS